MEGIKNVSYWMKTKLIAAGSEVEGVVLSAPRGYADRQLTRELSVLKRCIDGLSLADSPQNYA